MKTAIGPKSWRSCWAARYLDGLDPGLIAATAAENTEDPMQPREHGRRFLRQLAADGWLGISWPREYGGQGRTPVEQWLFAEELYNRRLPNGLLTLNSIGPTLMLIGSDQQKADSCRASGPASWSSRSATANRTRAATWPHWRTRAVRDGRAAT